MKPVTAARISLVVSLLVLGLKAWAYSLTGSVSLYSDALESMVNVMAALAAVWALRVSQRPPDENHPFGHTKAEYFSAVFEGALILFAAFEIVRAAWERLLEPAVPVQLGLGLGVALAATVLNAALAALLLRVGRAQRSPALVADGRHVRTDVWTTVGVLGGVGLAWATGWWIIDPILAGLLALHIVWVGWRLVRSSVAGLMDESLADEAMAEIQRAISSNLGAALEAHALRTRRAGPSTFVDLHLVVPGTMPVDAAHVICDRIEAAIEAVRPGSIVTIHVEPEGKAKHRGRVVRVGAEG